MAKKLKTVLNELDDYPCMYHYVSKGGEKSQSETDDFEYSQQNTDDDATQLPCPPYNLAAYHGADFESQPIL